MRTVAPPGSLCALFLGLNLPLPIDLGFIGGNVLIGAQALTIETNSTMHLSTACTTAF